MKKPKPKKLVAYGWAVECSRTGLNGRSFPKDDRNKAVEHKKMLDEEYSSCCKHKVVRVKITKI